MYKNIKWKKGINLVTLIITIAVALILISVTIVGVNNSVSNATITAFAEDLSKIQDAIKVYNLQNDAFPTPDTEVDAISQGDVLSDVPTNVKEKFVEELTLNGDYNTDDALGVFYKIDLGKLNVEKSVRGSKSGGNSSDIYVVSAKTMNVYYLEGVSVGNDVYFSLSNKIIKYTTNVETNEEIDVGETDIQTVGSITVKKLYKTWTNKMGITVSTYMDTGETLYLQVPDCEARAVTTTAGNNTFSFDSLDELASGIVPGITEDDKSLFDEKQGLEKYIQIFKEKNGNQIDIVKIDLSNYDNVAPTYENILFMEQEEENVIELNVLDDTSGVKEVRYEYISKYNENGEIENYYYDVNSLDEIYLKERGKKATVDKDGRVEIALPKEIEKVQILILDNAGNWLNFIQNTGSVLYIGVNLKSINTQGLTFETVFNSTNGLSNYTLQLSTDGTNYSTSIIKTVNTTEIVYTELVEDYKAGQTITDHVYIKIAATDNNSYESQRKTATAVFKFNLDVDTPEDSDEISGNKNDGYSEYFNGAYFLYSDSKMTQEITKVVIPDTQIKIISQAYMDYRNIKSVEIPDSVTSISDGAFEDCSALESVRLSSDITEIDDRTFMGCRRLKEINIPSKVDTIGSQAFCYCVRLSELELPDSLTSIGREAFAECRGLQSIKLSSSLTEIFEEAFKNCISLVTVDIPYGITEIADRTFSGCSSLTTVSLPSSVTTIGHQAFEYCENLTVKIPSSVTSVSSDIFDEAENITVIAGSSDVENLLKSNGIYPTTIIIDESIN